MFTKWGYEKRKSLTSILEEAPTRCYDTSQIVNDARTNTHYEITIDEPINVTHRYFESPMERMNLWMHVGPRQPKRNLPLKYIPGRTIVFDDFHKALLFVGYTSYKLPHGGAGFGKQDGMRLLSSKMDMYDSIVFRQHLDAGRACDDHCCPSGSVLAQEIVALRGWNISSCPGHARLRMGTGDCDCLQTRFC